MACADAPFRKYNLTDVQVRRDGYQTGLLWDCPWVPGGPWVPQRDAIRANDPEWDAYCDLRARHNELWRQGWKEGRAAAK